MATDHVPTSAPASPQLQYLQAWAQRLGLSGKLLAVGGLVGVVAVFLPWLTMSVQAPTLVGNNSLVAKGIHFPGVNASHSVMVVSDWRGTLCLVGYFAAVGLAFVLYPPNGLANKTLGWAGIGVGGVIALLGLWLLGGAWSGSVGFAGFGGGFQISAGFGAFLNLLAGAATATGGFLKAREEKLF